MTRHFLYNVGLLILLALAVMAGAFLLRDTTAPLVIAPLASDDFGEVTVVTDADGTRSIRDASGNLVRIHAYQRIVAASLLATEATATMVERDRIVAFSSYAQDGPMRGYQYADKPGVQSIADTERILALMPDLVLYNEHLDQATLARLREQGVATFDLGPMVGVNSFIQSFALVATLLDVPERRVHYLQGFRRRLAQVNCHRDEPAPEALFVVAIAGSLYGGTTGTSYADILHYAGVEDIAAGAYSGWPEYSPELLLALNPQWIVTSDRSVEALCTQSRLRELNACRTSPARIVAVPSENLEDVGAGILTAAEIVHDQIFGACPR